MMPSQKQSSRKLPNFSEKELECLIKEFGLKKQIMNLGSKSDKMEIWKYITAKINDLHPNFARSPDDVKRKWIFLLSNTKKKYSKVYKGSGGNLEVARSKLNQIERMILDIKVGVCPIMDGGIKNETVVDCGSELLCNDSGVISPANVTNAYGNSLQNSNVAVAIIAKAEPSFRLPIMDIDFTEFNEWFPEPKSKKIYFLLQGLKCEFNRDPAIEEERVNLMKRLTEIEEEREEERQERLSEYDKLLKLRKHKLELQFKIQRSKNMSCKNLVS